MNDDLRMTVHDRPDPADVRAVVDGLLAFNVERIGDPGEEQVGIFVRDAAGGVVGGLVGLIRWKWLYIAKLWLPDELRGRGLGTRLIRAAEEHARRRGCTHASLDTFEYQARPFYEKLGYRVFGTLEGFPPGYRQHYLARTLDDDATPLAGAGHERAAGHSPS